MYDGIAMQLVVRFVCVSDFSKKESVMAQLLCLRLTTRIVFVCVYVCNFYINNNSDFRQFSFLGLDVSFAWLNVIYCYWIWHTALSINKNLLISFPLSLIRFPFCCPIFIFPQFFLLSFYSCFSSCEICTSAASIQPKTIFIEYDLCGNGLL